MDKWGFLFPRLGQHLGLQMRNWSRKRFCLVPALGHLPMSVDLLKLSLQGDVQVLRRFCLVALSQNTDG